MNEQICIMNRKLFNSKILDCVNFLALYVLPLLLMMVSKMVFIALVFIPLLFVSIFALLILINLIALTATQNPSKLSKQWALDDRLNQYLLQAIRIHSAQL